MKSILLFLFFIPLICFSQHQISGILIDDKTKEVLPFATIRANNFEGTITDVDGKFTLISESEIVKLYISYIGYKPQTITLPKNVTFIKINLIQSVENLNEVIVSSRENPALRIIRNTIAKRKENNIEKKLNSFRFKSYNKLLVTANPDSISGKVDTIYQLKDGVKEIKKIDSSNYEFKKTLSRQHIYITEKISEHTFEKGKKKKETILASRMAGLKNPLYEFFAITIQDFSFYNDYYTIAGTKYINPIASNGLKHYNYQILDTVKNSSGNSYMIYFKPKDKEETVGLEGVLYIDNKTYSLTSVIAELRGIVNVKATQNFDYQEKDAIWFPINTQIILRKGTSNEAINLFGTKIGFGESKKDSTNTSTQERDASEMIYFSSKTTNFEIEINPKVKVANSANTIEISEEASEQSSEFWNKYRTDTLSNRGKETYIVIDSIALEENIEKKIDLARNVLKGYYPTKYVNLNLGKIIGYNNYEGFRFGIGGVTNTNFSKKYRISSYLAYGTKDSELKYHFGAAARLNRNTRTWIGANYTNDLKEAASLNFNTENNSFFLLNLRNLNLSQFYNYKTVSIYLEHDLKSNLETKLEFSTGTYEPTFDYTYISLDQITQKYTLSIATLGFQYNPKNEYMLSPIGKIRIQKGFPQFSLQVSQSFDQLLDGEFEFTQVNFRTIYEYSRLRRSTTSFLLQGGIVFGEAPITHLYNATPNYSFRDPWVYRVNFGGISSFETMGFNEFISDKYAMLQIKHKITHIKVGSKFNPHINFVTRAAIGDIENPLQHRGLTFKEMNDGFFESGIEFNNLFKGIGFSSFYRYGPYANPIWSDNLAVKITYHLNLGF